MQKLDGDVHKQLLASYQAGYYLQYLMFNKKSPICRW